MKKILVIMLGGSLVLASVAIFAFRNFANYPPLLGSGDGQSPDVDFLAFFSLALGGGGVLILLFAFLQWFGKWGPKHEIMVKRSTRH